MLLTKITISAFISLSLAIVALPIAVSAQELSPLDNTQPTDAPTETAQLAPQITSEDFIVADKKALFDAAESTLLPSTSQPTYRWDFSDSSLAQFGNEVIHEFNTLGIHKIQLTITQGEFQASTEKEVFVYNKKILMITDQNVNEKFQLVVNQAADQGVYLKVISAVEEETGFLTEEKLVPLIGEEYEFITEADGIIFYTSSSLAIQAFTRYWQNLESGKQFDLQEKLLVKITEQNMSIAAKLAQQSYSVFHPKFILLTRPEALNPIFENGDYNQLTTELASRAIEYRIVDSRSEKSSAFFLSHAITNFIVKGIPTNTIYLVLAYPFIVFIIVFARQVLGWSGFGVYTPSVISLSLLILGIYFGIGTIIIVVLVSYLLRTLLNKFKLLYMPKTGLILSSIGLSFLGLIWFLSYYEVSLAISLAIFPMLVMSTISEKFLSAQSEEGLQRALWGVLKTIIISIAAYYLVVWTAFTNLILSWPELIIVPLLGLIILGKFTGLRLNEYFRFRTLFKEKNIEE